MKHIFVVMFLFGCNVNSNYMPMDMYQQNYVDMYKSSEFDMVPIHIDMMPPHISITLNGQCDKISFVSQVGFREYYSEIDITNIELKNIGNALLCDMEYIGSGLAPSPIGDSLLSDADKAYLLSEDPERNYNMPIITCAQAHIYFSGNKAIVHCGSSSSRWQDQVGGTLFWSGYKWNKVSIYIP